jgi:hypothetical protein
MAAHWRRFLRTGVLACALWTAGCSASTEDGGGFFVPDAEVDGAAAPSDTAVSGDTAVSNDTAVSDDAAVSNDTAVSDDAAVLNDTAVSDDAAVSNDTAASNDTAVSDDAVTTDPCPDAPALDDPPCNGVDDDCDGQTDEDVTAVCSDDNACTEEACGEGEQAGQCVSTPTTCPDDSLCASWTCEPTSGCEKTLNQGAPCDDNNACTEAEVCKNGFCAGSAIVCDDGDPCTSDNCSPATGCDHPALPDGSPCGTKKSCQAGVCAPNGALFAHTSSALYRLDAGLKQFIKVGNFTFDKSSGSVTDIAINRNEVLYAVTFNDLFSCNSKTAACTWVMDLPESYNGLTFVPKGTVKKATDALIGVANSGKWTLLDFDATPPTSQVLGSYGSGYTSSGDAFSVAGVGTFATVKKTGQLSDYLVEINPATGAVIKEIGATGATNLWGFAWWDGVFYGFSSNSNVYAINTTTGQATPLTTGWTVPSAAWWGAGVSTEALF